tara:strand:- start:3449 stop:4003 length:555 start_codon:yes stop_codon:yes gene_type:complete
MKKSLYILLFFPFVLFGQGQVDCSLLSVTDVVIHNDSITFEIYNADTMDTHYPYIAYTLEANGDTIQSGQSDLYVTPAETSSYYYYTNFGNNFVMNPMLLSYINYPLSIYFTYSNLTGYDPGDYTCELSYNPQMDITNHEVNLTRSLLKTIDLQGRNTTSNPNPNMLLIDIYDDGTSKKRIIID